MCTHTDEEEEEEEKNTKQQQQQKTASVFLPNVFGLHKRLTIFSKFKTSFEIKIKINGRSPPQHNKNFIDYMIQNMTILVW